MRKLKNPLLFSVNVFLFVGCAQVVAPDGGPRDTKPPRVVRYQPDSAARHFSAKRITLRFDEFIQLKDISKQLVISPPLSSQPELRVKGKSLIIEMPDSLKPNTTYTMNFGGGITDIHEGNAMSNFRYVFSTGDYIDSLSVGGALVDAFTNAPVKDVNVMLYETDSDSLPLKNKPAYFARTGSDGNFSITNLHPGRYKVFALSESNANYRYDVSDEKIAFADKAIDLSKDYDSLRLRLFSEQKGRNRVKKVSQPSPGYFIVEFNRPAEQPSIELLGTNAATEVRRSEFSSDHDSLQYWIASPATDSLKLIVRDGSVLVDTIKTRILKTGAVKNSGRSGNAAPKFGYTSNISGGKIDLKAVPIMKFPAPLTTAQLEKIELYHGKTKLPLKPELDQTTLRTLKLNASLEEDSSYRVFIPPGALADIFGQKNDTINFSFRVREQRDYGTLKLKLKGLSGPPKILQLLDEKENVLREIPISTDGETNFDMLAAGGYKLKIIEDTNGNGKWDTGDYLAHRQPETVRYYTAPIKVRASWDLDIEWMLK